MINPQNHDHGYHNLIHFIADIGLVGGCNKIVLSSFNRILVRHCNCYIYIKFL